jgi:hypothetical protein
VRGRRHRGAGARAGAGARIKQGKTGDEPLTLCYLGEPTAAVDTIVGLTDGVFSDELSILGWRYKDQKHFGQDEEDFSQWPDEWKDGRATRPPVRGRSGRRTRDQGTTTNSRLSSSMSWVAASRSLPG